MTWQTDAIFRPLPGAVACHVVLGSATFRGAANFSWMPFPMTRKKALRTARLHPHALSLAAYRRRAGRSSRRRVKPAAASAQDMVQLDRISDPRVSPDGRFVVYGVRTMDLPANKASMSLWIADLKARMAPRRLAISEGGANSPRWSPDGKVPVLRLGSDRRPGLRSIAPTWPARPPSR